MSLTDLLQFLAAGRKSGTLKFDHGKITKQVYFKNGLIVGSKSNDPREYLGQVLLHYGKVEEGQLKAAREVQRTSGAKLGEVLVEQGFLTEAEVLEILKIRTLDAIYDLFLWTEGDFEFYDDESLPEDLLFIEVEPTTVIMEGIYRLDELSRYQTLVPSDRSVLELNAGWTYITGALDLERGALTNAGDLRRALDDLIAMADDPDPLFRRRLAQAEADVEVARLMGLEAASMLDSGRIPSIEVSVEKIFTSELRQRIADLAIDLLGPEGLRVGNFFERLYRVSPLMRFGGGTNEVLRDVIAQRGHKMPSYGR